MAGLSNFGILDILSSFPFCWLKYSYCYLTQMEEELEGKKLILIVEKQITTLVLLLITFFDLKSLGFILFIY
jgi:hypothetical protein